MLLNLSLLSLQTHPSCLEDLKTLKEFWDLADILKLSMVSKNGG